MSQFRLQTLLRLREIDRDQLCQQLAEAQRQEREAAGRLAQVDEAITELQRDSQIQPGPIEIAELVESERFAVSLKLQREAAQQLHRQLAEAAEMQRQELIEADKQLKVLEKLREKHEVHVRHEQAKRSLKLLDELAARGRAEPV